MEKFDLAPDPNKWAEGVIESEGDALARARERALAQGRKDPRDRLSAIQKAQTQAKKLNPLGDHLKALGRAVQRLVVEDKKTSGAEKPPEF